MIIDIKQQNKELDSKYNLDWIKRSGKYEK